MEFLDRDSIFNSLENKSIKKNGLLTSIRETFYFIIRRDFNENRESFEKRKSVFQWLDKNLDVSSTLSFNNSKDTLKVKPLSSIELCKNASVVASRGTLMYLLLCILLFVGHMLLTSLVSFWGLLALPLVVMSVLVFLSLFVIVFGILKVDSSHVKKNQDFYNQVNEIAEKVANGKEVSVKDLNDCDCLKIPGE